MDDNPALNPWVGKCVNPVVLPVACLNPRDLRGHPASKRPAGGEWQMSLRLLAELQAADLEVRGKNTGAGPAEGPAD